MSRSKFFTGKLYQRMTDDLHLAGMSERTHEGYLRAVRKLADYSQTSPDKITEDQLRRFFLHQKNDLHYAYGTLRVAFSGVTGKAIAEGLRPQAKSSDQTGSPRHPQVLPSR